MILPQVKLRLILRIKTECKVTIADCKVKNDGDCLGLFTLHSSLCTLQSSLCTVFVAVQSLCLVEFSAS